MGAPDFPRRPLADKFVYRALVHVNAYKCAIFQLHSCTSFRYKEGVLKFNVEAITLKLLYVLKVLNKIKQRAKFQHRISMHHAVMRICISHRLSIVCAQNCFLGGGCGLRCENTVF